MISELSSSWRRAGMEPGNIVLVHSSIKRTLLSHGITPTELLNSLLDAVTDEGTLLLPLFNFEFTKGMPFDIKQTPSHMGALTEAARVHPKAVRSGHPLYSFAAIGPQAEAFRVDNRSGYGSDSPFAVLRKLDGKIAVIDLEDQNSMTSYHHVEEMHEVDYRYHKHFEAPYTDISGVTTDREYSLFVRDTERGVQTDVNRMGAELWRQGLYTGDKPGEGAGMRSISARSLYDSVSEVIRAGDAEQFLYSIES